MDLKPPLTLKTYEKHGLGKETARQYDSTSCKVRTQSGSDQSPPQIPC
jgi:hypothetical protein